MLPKEHLLPPVPVDVTKKDTLTQAFENADAVVSLVGILQGSLAQFEAIQWKGAENVALAAAAVGAKLVHISAIGADPSSKIPYAKTKALGEEAVLSHCPNATIVRPSLIFGPGDGLFNVRIVTTRVHHLNTFDFVLLAEIRTTFPLLACASCLWERGNSFPACIRWRHRPTR
jgi:uncharacterized protein YbjT (DUF2867 family)